MEPQSSERLFEQRARTRARRQAMLARRRAVVRTLLFGLILVLSFSATAGISYGNTSFTLFDWWLSGVLLWVSVALSDGVPFWRPNSNGAVILAVAAWAVGFAITAVNSADTGQLDSVALFGIMFALGLPLLVRKRFKRIVRTRQWIGAAILIGALLIGADLLTGPGAPGEPETGISLTASDLRPDTPGLLMNLDLYPNDCSELFARVEVFGSDELWRHTKHSSGPIVFQLMLPAHSANHVRVEAQTNPVAAYVDTLPERFKPTLYPAFDHGRIKSGDLSEFPVSATLVRVEQFGANELIEARVSSNWRTVHAPIEFWFEPDWLTPNGLQSCYLQTPPIFGPRVWPPPESPAWDTLDIDHIVSPSLGSVTLHGAWLVSGTSTPQPSAGDAASLTWTCSERGLPGPLRPISQRNVESYPLSDYRSPPSADCGQTTPLQETTAPAIRELAIFLVGGLVSLGLALLVGAAPLPEDPHDADHARQARTRPRS